MKRKVIKLLLISSIFTIISCNNNGSNSNVESSFFSETISSDYISNNISIINPNLGTSSSSSSEIESIYSEEQTLSSEYYSSSEKESLSSETKVSSEKESSYSQVITSKDYELLTTPNNKNNPIDITDWKNYSFVEELPDGFTYIYGNNKATPDIYADGGGLVMDENEGPRKGLQTPYFNTWNKIELRIKLGKFHGTSKSQNKNDPVFTIDCYSESGSLIDTYYIDEINVSDNSEVKTYIKNSSISYLEIRATNLPSKSNKVYNFGISGISLKGWIYD